MTKSPSPYYLAYTHNYLYICYMNKKVIIPKKTGVNKIKNL